MPNGGGIGPIDQWKIAAFARRIPECTKHLGVRTEEAEAAGSNPAGSTKESLSIGLAFTPSDGSERIVGVDDEQGSSRG